MSDDNMAFKKQPQEDAGAETLSRYQFQHELAARRCVKVHLQDEVEKVICEWHTDYIVCFRDGRVELVSVKHLEPGQLPWTIRELCDDGGMRTLFERWDQ